MADVVRVLRGMKLPLGYNGDVLRAAADEIVRLREEMARYRAALVHAVEWMALDDCSCVDDEGGPNVKACALCGARALLFEGE